MAESMATPMFSREPATLDPMTTRTAFFKSLVPCIALLLISCGSTRHTASPHAESLTGFVLISGAVPDGTETHVISEDASGTGGSGGYDCDAAQIECFERCWNSPPPQTSIKRGSGKHHEACSEKCLEEYLECVKEQEQWEEERKKKELHFLDMATALTWLRSHKTELMIGTVVVAGGVAYVIATGGTGALLLVPLAL